VRAASAKSQVRASARYTASPWLLFGETLTLIQIAEMLVGALGGIIVTRGKTS
jgi:hypothetical protein